MEARRARFRLPEQRSAWPVAAPLQPGDPFPDLELPDHAGNARRLSELVAGDPTVLHCYPGLRVSDRSSVSTATDADRATNRWLGPVFVAIIFVFTSIAVINTLVMIALQRGRELALLRLVGATPGQVRSMARWDAGLIIAIGLGLGLAIGPRRCCHSATR